MKPKTINEYISTFPKDVAKRLRLIKEIVKKEAPEAKEVISYGMPAFKLNGILIYFAAFKNHIGFYPMQGAIKAFQKNLSAYKTAKGTIQFPLEKPLPITLIRNIVRHRVKEKSGNISKEKKGSTKKFVYHHKDGSVWAKGQMKGKKMEGYWEWYRKDGSKMRSGYFLNGKQTGIWTTYDKRGKTHKITDFSRKTGGKKKLSAKK